MKKQTIIKNGLIWTIDENSITVTDGRQAVIYSVYELANKQPLKKMANILKNSPSNYYATWPDALSLGVQLGVRGHGK